MSRGKILGNFPKILPRKTGGEKGKVENLYPKMLVSLDQGPKKGSPEGFEKGGGARKGRL